MGWDRCFFIVNAGSGPPRPVYKSAASITVLTFHPVPLHSKSTDATNGMIKSLISIEAKGLLACLGRSTLSCKRPSARHFSGLPRKQPREEQLVQKIAGSDRPAREWEKRDASIKKRFGSWNPTRKISRQKMQEMRDLTVSMPHLRTIDLANMYTISPEAVRRILESK